MVLIIKLSILIVKIIINVHFEMRNFLPRLTDPNFFEVLNEEEKRVIYIPDIESNMNQILEDISSIDENCRRLVDNFSIC